MNGRLLLIFLAALLHTGHPTVSLAEAVDAAGGQARQPLARTSPAVSPAIAERIRGRVEMLMFGGELSVSGVEILSGEILADLYAARDFRPLWHDPAKIVQLELLVEFAYREGLDPRDYPLPAIKALLDQPLPLSDRDAADLDILATEALIRVGYQLRFGKVNPNGLFSDWNFARSLAPGQAAEQTILEMVAADSLVDATRSWLQRGELYLLLKQALAKYRRIQAAGGWPALPDGPTLRPGEVDARVPLLRQRLLAEGDLTAPAAPSDLFDDAVAEAVLAFQRRHGLDADGAVGELTRQAMNVPVAARIDQLRASLERGRWVMDETRAAGDRLLLVNIASAQVALIEHGSPVFVTRAQVGRPYRQTPVFKGKIEYLVFNPTWTVPPTILRQDVIPKLLEDADAYLTGNHMDLLDRSGNPVDPARVDWTAISADNFPYIVRQRPGPWNSLGRVKFIFPNSHFVFLHDTPAQDLFDRAGRAFSSGCIRVEDPFELAERVMNEPRWHRESFQQVLDTREERVVHLAVPMTIFLMYWTGMADPDGTVRFYEDIYGRDAVLLKAMAQAPVISG